MKNTAADSSCFASGPGLPERHNKRGHSGGGRGCIEKNSLDRRAIKCAASIDLKQAEQGLLDFCSEWNLPVRFYTSEELRSVPGDFTSSAFVQNMTGVDNVCERAALIGAEKLIVKKTAGNGVTVALAEEHWEVQFG